MTKDMLETISISQLDGATGGCGATLPQLPLPSVDDVVGTVGTVLGKIQDVAGPFLDIFKPTAQA